jgi:long-subunit acyl-CoA synthetase (AMP-forming)
MSGTAAKFRSADELRRMTAPALLLERARQNPNDVAFRAKQLGIYRERTWRDYAEMVARAAKALTAEGLRAGDRVAIMADVCEEWLICDQAAQSLGAIVYGIYPTASPQEVEYQMRDGGAVLFIAEDQEFVDRILPLVDRLPAQHEGDAVAGRQGVEELLEGVETACRCPQCNDREIDARGLLRLAARLRPGLAGLSHTASCHRLGFRGPRLSSGEHAQARCTLPRQLDGRDSERRLQPR